MLADRKAPVPRPEPVAGFESVRCHWDAALQTWVAKILPGEFYVTVGNEAVSTVLGSCIAACLRDTELGIGGMNHFMLPDNGASGSHTWTAADGGPSTRYGVHAMERLINEILKLGARRERFEVKLFGGGRILKTMTDIGARNIRFAREFLEVEGLRTVAEDVGGPSPRHVIYFPSTGRVLMKALKPVEVRSIEQSDDRYRAALARSPVVDDDVELFS